MKNSKELLDELIRLEVGDRVYQAFKKVDRKLFVPERWTNYAYSDSAIPLDTDSSISQPSLVARMIDILQLKGPEHILEIGTASGYSAAILSLCCRRVDTFEINKSLAKNAKKKLKLLGFNNITVHAADGSAGLPSKAPFDGIIVTAAARQMPSVLINQLKVDGRIVIPIGLEGSDTQELILGIKKKNRLIRKSITIVKFVPLI